MDIKLKGSKPFRIWLCFFIGINIIASYMFLMLANRSDAEYFNANVLRMDYKDTGSFKYRMGSRFDFLAKYITYDWNDNHGGTAAQGEDQDIVYEEDPITGGYEITVRADEEDFFREEVDWNIRDLNDEGQNLIYYANNPKLGVTLTNSDTDLGIPEKGSLTLPDGYDSYIYYDGNKFIAQKNGKPFDIYDNDYGYRNTMFGSYMGEFWKNTTPHQDVHDIRDCQVLLAVKKDLVKIPYAEGYSIMFLQKNNLDKLKRLYIGFLGVLVTWVGLFIFSVVKREFKQELERMIGGLLGKTILELKISASIIILITLSIISYKHYWTAFLKNTSFALVCFWWLYFAWIDIRTNGRGILSNNIISGMRKRYRKLQINRPFQKAQLSRLYYLVGTEIFLIIVTFIFLGMVVGGRDWSFMIPALVTFGIGIFIFYRYVRRYASNLDDIGKIIDQTERIRQGDINTKLKLSPDPDLYKLEDNLNAIQEGVAKAAESSVRSERMKVELITNISHDLKTPLTSIISYVDLLSKEQELPEHVKDYIKVLAQKSERLKLLIQDLFDLSKAVSGEMEFEMKTLDLAKLIEQTLADLEDKITESGLIFRVNLSESPVPIVSDGNKLYRVFLNLFQNTLKYSLTGTRVYVDLAADEGKAVVTIKNTANYEMNFSEEEIIERFVRGDKARSSEGSGLGLAIAQNFTRACGGDFDIKVDGDLFKVILTFDKEPDKNIEKDTRKGY